MHASRPATDQPDLYSMSYDNANVRKPQSRVFGELLWCIK